MDEHAASHGNGAIVFLTLLALVVGGITLAKWRTMPVLRRTVAVFLIGLVLHVLEETRFPGGFAELIAAKTGFTFATSEFGAWATAAYIVVLVFVPFIFPKPFLVVAALLLGVLEPIMHTAEIWVFQQPTFYTPGLFTAVFVLFPVSLFGLRYVAKERLLKWQLWPLSALYMIAGLALTQQIVFYAGGISYFDFVRRMRAAVLHH